MHCSHHSLILLTPFPFRKFCELGTSRTWSELTDLISPERVHSLIHAKYKRASDVDLYTAGNMEVISHGVSLSLTTFSLSKEPVVGSILGPTFHCLVREQFQRLKDGDRFFYSHEESGFTDRQLAAIRTQTLARVICDTCDEPNQMSLPVDVFRQMNTVDNPVFACNNVRAHPKLDLSAWR